MAADIMVENGRPVYGTALHRLHALAGERSEKVHAHAGDVHDVCDACDPKNKAVAAARAAVKAAQGKADDYRPGLKVHMPTTDLRALVEVALKQPLAPAPEPENPA